MFKTDHDTKEDIGKYYSLDFIETLSYKIKNILNRVNKNVNISFIKINSTRNQLLNNKDKIT